MTLSDTAMQLMRNTAIRMMRDLGNFAGGCNVQFALNPDTEEIIAIEINPRVSRSSALASKATGFPIAKIAAKLAVGYTLDEIRNDITRETPASFEPTIDYCVIKVPRFTFEKFPQADATLTTQMKSVGEAMAIGRTFKEALQKALRSLETKRFGLCGDGSEKPVDAETLRLKLAIPNADRIFYIAADRLMEVALDRVPAPTAGMPKSLIFGPAIGARILVVGFEPSADGTRFLIPRASSIDSEGGSVHFVEQWVKEHKEK